MTSFDDIRKRASRPTDTVSLCLAGELGEKHDRLVQQLAEVKPATSLGDGAAKRDIAEAIVAVEQDMKAATVEFHLRAFSPRAWGVFWDGKPERAEGEPAEAWDARISPFWCELISRSTTDPEMTPEQVAELEEDLNSGTWTRLVNKCVVLNHREVDVPNSEAASELIGTSEQT